MAFKYRFNRKEKKIALGAYPETGLEDARRKETRQKNFFHKGLTRLKFGSRKKHVTRLNVLRLKEYRLFVLPLTEKSKFGKATTQCG